MQMTLQPRDREVSCGCRPVNDWVSMFSSASFNSQAGTAKLLMWELSRRSDVTDGLTTEQLDNQTLRIHDATSCFLILTLGLYFSADWETVHFLWSQQPTEQLTWCVWVCAVLLRFLGYRTNSLSWQKERSLQVAPTWYHQLSCLGGLALSETVARSAHDESFRNTVVFF